MKRQYFLSLVCYLLIPAAAIGGVAIAMLVNPESAAGSPDYGRNFRWLANLQHALLLAAAAGAGLLWIACCAFLLRSKQQAWAWVLLAAFGPFGFVVLSWLRDKAPAAGDAYAAFVGGLKLPLRIVYEAAFFAAVWAGAYQAMLVKRELSILYRSAATGMSVDDILREQAASSGMWAFGEGLVILYFVPLAYMLWPVAFNLFARWRAEA